MMIRPALKQANKDARDWTWIASLPKGEAGVQRYLDKILLPPVNVFSAPV
jgi:hypothetical protein